MTAAKLAVHSAQVSRVDIPQPIVTPLALPSARPSAAVIPQETCPILLGSALPDTVPRASACPCSRQSRIGLPDRCEPDGPSIRREDCPDRCEWRRRGPRVSIREWRLERRTEKYRRPLPQPLPRRGHCCTPTPSDRSP